MNDIAGIWVTPPLTFPGDPPEEVKSAFYGFAVYQELDCLTK